MLNNFRRENEKMKWNFNFIGNCIPILITIGNMQAINEFFKTKTKIRIFSVVYGIVGCLIILLLNIDKQAAFEWIGLYSVLYFQFEYVRNKSSKFFSLSDTVEKDNYPYYIIISPFILIAGIILIIFSVSPFYFRLFSQYFYSNDRLYYLSKYNYIICSLSFFGYYIIIKNKCFKRNCSGPPKIT